MSLAVLATRVAAHNLAIFGGFHAGPGDDLPTGTRTLLLLGPAEPGFWPKVSAEPEFSDLNPDPLDRWSRRVIGGLACDLGGKALFPFGGPPYRPFYAWALRSGRAWASPVALLVQAEAGLLVSYRGALALREAIDTPPPVLSPCLDCAEQPCRAACPAQALTGPGYDLPACHAYLATPPGADCIGNGCAVRRACPVSRRYARLPEQSAYHMRLFHP